MATRIKRLQVKPFMDINTMLGERLAQCCVHVGTRRGLRHQCVPFCAAQAWPELSASRPSLRLRVVGAGELPASWEPLPAGIEHVGYVADPLPELQRATALVAPLDIAGGSRQKLVEALATACPVLAVPAKKSSTASPGSVAASIRYCSTPTGFG